MISLAVKGGTPRKQTASNRGLNTTRADVLCKQRRRACTMNHRKARKPAPNSVEQGEADRLEAPTENHGQSGHRQQVTRLRCGQPEGRRCGPAWHHRRSHHRPAEKNRTSRQKLEPKKDFAILCPNCHSVSHRMDDVSDLDGLLAMIAIAQDEQASRRRGSV